MHVLGLIAASLLIYILGKSSNYNIQYDKNFDVRVRRDIENKSVKNDQLFEQIENAQEIPVESSPDLDLPIKKEDSEIGNYAVNEDTPADEGAKYNTMKRLFRSTRNSENTSKTENKGFISNILEKISSLTGKGPKIHVIITDKPAIDRISHSNYAIAYNQQDDYNTRSHEHHLLYKSNNDPNYKSVRSNYNNMNQLNYKGDNYDPNLDVQIVNSYYNVNPSYNDVNPDYNKVSLNYINVSPKYKSTSLNSLNYNDINVSPSNTKIIPNYNNINPNYNNVSPNYNNLNPITSKSSEYTLSGNTALYVQPTSTDGSEESSATVNVACFLCKSSRCAANYVRIGGRCMPVKTRG